MSKAMAEGKGLEPLSPKAPVFKTGALPITLTLREKWSSAILSGYAGAPPAAGCMGTVSDADLVGRGGVTV